MTPEQIARNLVADHLAALTVDTWEIRDVGWTGDPGVVARAVDDLCHHLDGILAPEPEPDTSGSVPNRAAESVGAGDPHQHTPERENANLNGSTPRWRVGRSWGVTIVEQAGLDRLAATAQTREDAARIVAALNAAEERELDAIVASVRGDQPERGTPCSPDLDLDAIQGKWLALCPVHDAGVAGTCACPEADHRPVMAQLLARVRQLEHDRDRLAAWVGHWTDLADTRMRQRDEARAELVTARRNGAADLIDRFETELRRMGLDPDGPDDSLGFVRSLRLLIHLNRTTDTTEESAR